MPDGDACLLDSSILFWSGKGFSSAIPRRRLGSSGTPRSAQLDKDGSGLSAAEMNRLARVSGISFLPDRFSFSSSNSLARTG